MIITNPIIINIMLVKILSKFPTFVHNRLIALIMITQKGDIRYNNNQKLVKKARRESARDTKINFMDTSKSALSKQNHSPIYE